MADPSLSLKQRALVSDAARSLDKAKMMRFDEKSGNFYCTELGRIASHFYIQYSSVETYNEMLRRHMNDSEVIDPNIWCSMIMSYGQEFNELSVNVLSFITYNYSAVPYFLYLAYFEFYTLCAFLFEVRNIYIFFLVGGGGGEEFTDY